MKNKKIVHHCPCGEPLPKMDDGYGYKIKYGGVSARVCEKCANRIADRSV